jgi:hypothetical protein
VGAALLDGAVATSQRAGADLALATGALEERSAERQQQNLLEQTRMLARDEDWQRVVVRATQLMQSPNVPAALSLEALALRARAHEALGARSAALVDVNAFLARAPLSDPRYDDVRVLQRALLQQEQR